MTTDTAITILLVEDNPGDARLVEILLSDASSSAGFDIVHAERLGEALQRLSEQVFDVILLDLSLPDSSDLETVSRTRAAAPRTPIVVLSGQDDEETALRALQRGAQDYLLKGRGSGDTIARVIRYSIERERAEEELRRSEERLRLLVDGVKDYAIFILDPHGHVTTWNEGAERTQGYSAEEIIGEHFSVFYTQEDIERGRPEEELDVATRDGRFEEEGLRVRKDGSRFWANVVITALRDETGNLRGFSKVTRDITASKEAEEALRRSLKELADLKFALDESAIVAMTDQGGKITYVNDKFCEISKYPRDELLGQAHRILNSDYHPKDLIDELWRTIERGDVWRGELRDRTRDGGVYWVDATVVPLLNERGKPYRYVAVCNDITGRKEAEEALRRSLRELADLKFALDESAIVAMTDVSGRITYVNDKFCEISKYEREELLGQDHRIISSNYHPKEFTDELWRTIEQGEVWRGEIRDRAKDGGAYWMDTTVVPFLNQRGKPYRYVAICSDITARKEAEEALKASEERFRVLIRNASDIITVLDAEGKILYESPAVERILGFKPEDRVGTSAFEQVHPDDVGWIKSKLAKLLKSPQERTSMWYRVRDREGSWHHLEAIATNLLQDPVVRGIVVNIRDITERRRAEEALRVSEELYRSVVEQAAETIFLIDLESKRIIESNAALHRSLGYTAQELKGMTLYDIVAHDRESTDRNIGSVLENGRYHIGERKYRRKDGRLVDMEVSATTLSYGDRETQSGRGALCIVARDVTEPGLAG